jgi:hypothetical protein
VHIAGVAQDARRSAVVNGQVDYRIYGNYRPSHHLLVRRVTVQNLFDREERDGETSEGQSMDGMKFNQVQDLWVLDSRIQQTTRHGIDSVGVHRAAFCRNVVSRIGGGLGIEAKGGSVDILYDGNLFHRVRRVELGGEETDATYYFSADGARNYEARRVTARNNLIVDAREAALEFSGCQDCTAVNNTIFHSAGYRAPRDGDSIYGGDAVRVHDSRLLGAADGAGSDCQFWDDALQDHVTVDPCWGLGANAPAPVGRTLRSARLTVANNLFVSVVPLWGSGGGAVVPCRLNIVGGDAQPAFDGNLWWNGGSALPAEGCSRWPRAAHRASRRGCRWPARRSTSRASSRCLPAWCRRCSPRPAAACTAAPPARWPRCRRTTGCAPPRAGAAAIGALAGRSADEVALDRLANWAERAHAAIFAQAATSQQLSGYYLRHQPQTQTYVGTAGGPPCTCWVRPSGRAWSTWGPLTDWLPQVLAAGVLIPVAGHFMWSAARQCSRHAAREAAVQPGAVACWRGAAYWQPAPPRERKGRARTRGPPAEPGSRSRRPSA